MPHERRAWYVATHRSGSLGIERQLAAVACTHPITLATYGACTHDVAQQPWVQPTVQQAFAHDTLTLFRSH